MDVPTSNKDPGAAQKRVAGVPPGRPDPEKRVTVGLMVTTFFNTNEVGTFESYRGLEVYYYKIL